jgi:hypothetical protein
MRPAQPQATTFPPSKRQLKMGNTPLSSRLGKLMGELSLIRALWEKSRYIASVAARRGGEVTPGRGYWRLYIYLER